MKLKHYITITVSMLMALSSFGQSTKTAQRYFDQYAYVKAAELYENIVKRGDSSQVVLENLSEAYYKNNQIEKAQQAYQLLMDKYKTNIDPEHFFNYGQVLKASGNKEEADQWLHKFANLTPDDDRSKRILNGINLNESDKDISVLFSNPKNLEENTEYSDFTGSIYNNDLYFFSSRPSSISNKIYKWNDQPFLNVYSGNIQGDNSLSEVNELSGDVNTRYHEATVAITKDGKTMYFTRDNYNGKKLGKDEEKTTHLKLYKATNQDGKWIDVVELPFNSDLYSIGHPTLSNDEKTLYFVSDMPSGMGGTDLYKVSVVDGELYGTPRNLGSKINTEANEMFPFVGHDDNLYFSSNGHAGYGLLDVFKSKINDDNNYGDVINLGKGINSSMDDFGLVFNQEKNKGFFSSNRPGGKGDDDIYAVKMDVEEPCIQDIAGVVTDQKTAKPLADAVVKLLDADGVTINETRSNLKGEYKFDDITCNSPYTVFAQKLNYEDNHADIKAVKDNFTHNADIPLGSLIKEDNTNIVGSTININPIYFDLDKHYIRPDAEYELEKVITVLRNNPTMVIKIESHTDSRANDEYNRALSDRRAKSSRDYILSRGIPSYQIQSAIGYGEQQLVNRCSNGVKCSEQEHQQNRRSMFIIVKR